VLPHLALRGKLIVGACALFVVLGAIHGSAPLIALGGVNASALMAYYLWFFPTAILLRRRKVELSWWVPPGDQPGGALTVDRPFHLHLALRNHGQRRLRVFDIAIMASRNLEVPERIEALVPAGHQVEVIGVTRARSSGYQVFHGAVLRFGDALGLFDLSAFFPNPIAVKVFPKQASLGGGSRVIPQGGTLHERVGVHQVRRRGLAGDLRELREHAHGDPFKYIAWKATARRQKLMVRELETEIVVTHQILVDIAGSMRRGAPGRTPLDFAIETAAGLARSAIDGGDRVGLVTFDSRIYSEIKPGEGHHHYLQLLDRLIELHNVVDEDLTDLTDGELVSAVARYLAHQEAVDCRLEKVPRLDDPAWDHVQAGPTGELYDLKALSGVVSALLRAMGQTRKRHFAPGWWWSRVQVGDDSDPSMAKLRLFARLRGIELPYLDEHERGLRARGLAAALRRVSGGRRADLVAILSDFHGFLENPAEVSGALARVRRGGRQVVALLPFAPEFCRRPDTEVGALVAAALIRDEEERFRQVRRRLLAAGVPVLKVGPRDSVSSLATKLSRARPSRRVA
jgi:uncharacterized protein (DUF58 family)